MMDGFVAAHDEKVVKEVCLLHLLSCGPHRMDQQQLEDVDPDRHLPATERLCRWNLRTIICWDLWKTKPSCGDDGEMVVRLTTLTALSCRTFSIGSITAAALPSSSCPRVHARTSDRLFS